jgi:hypothetical protein
MRTLPEILHDLKQRLDAEEAHIEVAFTYFVTKKLPFQVLLPRSAAIVSSKVPQTERPTISFSASLSPSRRFARAARKSAITEPTTSADL